MTKKYILTKDQIESTVKTSEFPASATAVQTELAKKVDIAQGTGNAGKFMKVGSDGNLTPAAIDAQVKANWTETDTASAAFIQNKPFKTIGTGLSVVADALTADTQFKFQIFDTLPTAAATYAQTIALIANGGSGQNVYDEYGCVQVEDTWQWELFGTTMFTLNIVQNASGITINNTALQSATSAQKGLLTAADWTTFNGKQNALTFDNSPTASSSNPVKSGGVYTALANKVDKVSGSSLVADTKVSAYDTHIANGDIHVTSAQKTAWTAKQEKIAAGTSGNVVTYSGTAGTVGSLGFDTAPTASSANLVKSGAILTALNGKVDEVEGTVALGKDSTGYYFNE